MSTSLYLGSERKRLLYELVMHRVSRLALVLILALVSSGGMAAGEQASPSPTKPNLSPTPIPLTTVAIDAQSAMASLQQIDTSLAQSHSSAGVIGGSPIVTYVPPVPQTGFSGETLAGFTSSPQGR